MSDCSGDNDASRYRRIYTVVEARGMIRQTHLRSLKPNTTELGMFYSLNQMHKTHGPPLGRVTQKAFTQTFDVSICLQPADNKQHIFFFLAGLETDCFEEAAEVLTLLSRAGTVAESLPRPETMNKRVL